jgi:hypothetical protein
MPLDVIVIGGGSFGPIFAEHSLAAEKAHSHQFLASEPARRCCPSASTTRQ